MITIKSKLILKNLHKEKNPRIKYMKLQSIEFIFIGYLPVCYNVL